MSINKNLAIAALAGLLSAGAMTASVAFAGEHDKAGCKGKAGAEKANCKTAGGKEKHACKGHNSCKGNSPDGKNACKGKSACATDGSK